MFENKISEETTAKALVYQMDNGETDGTYIFLNNISVSRRRKIKKRQRTAGTEDVLRGRA